MHQGLPSFTALFVAGARALSSRSKVASCDAGDDSAHAILPRRVARVLRALERTADDSALTRRAIASLSIGIVDHLALRTRAIDTRLLAAVERGVDQLVILGAGLDTRAHRIEPLRNVRVLEVDHPDTQAGKRARAQRLPLMASGVTYVPVDFARDALEVELARQGHDPTRPTCFIWEGVVPYLTQQAVVDTLRRLRPISAPGSELLVTYAPGSLLRATALLRAGMRLLGEPLHYLPERDELAALLSAEGFDVVADTDTADWRTQHAQWRSPGPRVTFERLAVARPK